MLLERSGEFAHWIFVVQLPDGSISLRVLKARDFPDLVILQPEKGVLRVRLNAQISKLLAQTIFHFSPVQISVLFQRTKGQKKKEWFVRRNDAAFLMDVELELHRE